MIIELNKPNEIKTVKFNKKLESLIRSGLRSSEIKLQLNFIVTDKDAKILFSHFQSIKNHMFLSLDTKTYNS
jgi:hypothetical protein